MDFWDVIEKRKSVRAYQPGKTISREILDKLLEAGKRAPSAGAIYPVEFMPATERDQIAKLCVACRNQQQVANATAVIVVAVDPEKTAVKYGDIGRNLYAIQDAAAAIENILLGATALGLATCWVGGFEEDEVKSILNMPSQLRVQAVITLGYE